MLNHPGKIALVFLLFGIFIYFGFRITPKHLQTQTDSKTVHPTEVSNVELQKQAEAQLESVQKAELDELKEQLTSPVDSIKLHALKRISGLWYDHNQWELAGDYAIEVAKLENTAASWGIAGSSYLPSLEESNSRAMECQKKAISCLDKAITMDPENPQFKMNKALCLVKLPGDNPMEGIMMLRELDKSNPEYLPVQISLSQLAMQTRQWDKAYDRLQRALSKYPENEEINCLLVELIKNSGKNESTAAYEKRCNH